MWKCVSSVLFHIPAKKEEKVKKKREKSKKTHTVCISEMTGMEWNCVSSYDSVLLVIKTEIFICLRIYIYTHILHTEESQKGLKRKVTVIQFQ